MRFKFERFPFLIALCFLLCGWNAFAQNSRKEEMEQKQSEKAKNLKTYVPNKVERIVTQLTTPKSGFYPLVGSAFSGGGFALGVGYRRLIGDRDFAEIHGMYSIEGYKQLGASAAILQSPHGLYRTDLYAKYVD